MSTNIWLSKWTDRSKSITSTNRTREESISRVQGIAIYSALGGCQGIAIESNIQPIRKRIRLQVSHV